LTPILDELFESFEIAFNPTRNYPQHIAGLFDETFVIIHELKADAGTIWTDRSKVYSTRSILTAFALPGDEMVGNLIRDSCVPFLIFARDLGLPTQSLIILLCHLLDALHEARKFLKLGPLIIDRADRALDIDPLFHSFHKFLRVFIFWRLKSLKQRPANYIPVVNLLVRLGFNAFIIKSHTTFDTTVLKVLTKWIWGGSLLS